MKRKRKIIFEKAPYDQSGHGLKYSWHEITDAGVHSIIWEIIEQMKKQGKFVEFCSYKIDYYGYYKVIVKCDKKTFIEFANNFVINLGNKIQKVKW